MLLMIAFKWYGSVVLKKESNSHCNGVMKYLSVVEYINATGLTQLWPSSSWSLPFS